MADAIFVSVVIPAFRAEATIGRAVRSLLAQDYRHWEAVVASDDGSDYAALLAAAGLDDPRLRFVSTGRLGSGAPNARNAALAAVRGELVAPLDADDLWDAGRLSALVPPAAARGAAFDNVRVVDDTDGRVMDRLFAEGEGSFDLDLAGFLGTSVPLMAVAARQYVDGWDEDAGLGDDVVFNARLFDRLGALPVTRRSLHEYRVRPGSVCHGPESAAFAERCYLRLLDRLDADGLGLARSESRAAFRAAIERKRQVNAAFEAARRGGRVRTFQEFVAAGGARAIL